MGHHGLLGHILRTRCLRKAAYLGACLPYGAGTELDEFINGLSEEQIETMKENVAKIQWLVRVGRITPFQAADWYCSKQGSNGQILHRRTYENPT